VIGKEILSFQVLNLKVKKITIDTEEKYLYWFEKTDVSKDDEDIREMIDNDDSNFIKLWVALENFLYVTHRIDDHHWDK
jgi:hypothetical protein